MDCPMKTYTVDNNIYISIDDLIISCYDIINSPDFTEDSKYTAKEFIREYKKIKEETIQRNVLLQSKR